MLQVKLRANILAEMNAFLQKRHEEDEALRNEIDAISETLNKYDHLYAMSVRAPNKMRNNSKDICFLVSEWKRTL